MGGVPRHQRVSDWLREQIEGGRYGPNDQLPSEKELGDRFDVSRITVRRALATLEGHGLIYRRQGLGSFVSEPRLRQGLVRLTDFAQDMERAGLEASSRVLHRAPEEASPEVAEALEIEPGMRLLRLDRLRLGDGLPIAFDRTWLPLYYAQLLEGHDLAHTTIYRVLEKNYGIAVLGGQYRMEAVNAEPDVAAVLEVAPGSALMVVNRISYTLAKRRIYFQRRYYRSDRIAFELEVEREEGIAGAEGAMPLREFEPVFRRRREEG